MGTPAAVKVGPGLLYVAPIGTTEPSDVSGTLPSANWLPVGFTEEGHTLTAATTFEDVEVAESLDPILVLPTKRDTMIEFSMAEITATNLLVAYNGGTISSPTGGYVTVEPPALGAEVRLMLCWNSDDHQERLLLRKVIQVGSVAIPRKKAPNKAVIPVQFRCEVPANSSAPFKHWEPSSLSYANPH